MNASLASYRPRALFGAPLGDGDLVRYIYIDEAAKHAPAPVTVVAGIIAKPDEHWRTLDARIRDVRQRLISDAEWEMLGRHFHASKLFNGGKLDREEWPPQRRHAILRELLTIIREEEVPVSIGYVRRDHAKYQEEGMTEKTAATWDHLIAFIQCVNCADKFLRRLQPPETATLIVEMMKEKHIKNYLSTILDGIREDGVPDHIRAETEITQIVEAISFQDKQGPSLLQLADLCAYIVGRYFQRKDDVGELMKALTGSRAPFDREVAGGQLLIAPGWESYFLVR